MDKRSDFSPRKLPFSTSILPSFHSDTRRKEKENEVYLSSQENLKEHSLIIEYKMLKKLAPYGVYVMPSMDNIRRWNGVMFIRQGHYKNAILKFLIVFPEEYPAVPPTVTFISPVYHALVSSETGELDLTPGIKQWIPGQHFTITLLNYLKKIFLIPAYYKREDSHNRDAARNYLHNLEEFTKEANKCVQVSLLQKFEADESCCIKFTPFTTVHKKILDNLLTRPEKDESQQVEGFVKWFINTITEQ